MKKIPILNIFTRSRAPTNDELQTDAVPVDDPPGACTNASSEIFGNSPSLTSSDFNAAMQLEQQMAETNSNDLAMVQANNSTEVIESPARNTSITNNQMALHQTQGQVVMQFSNITGLHFGSVYNFNSDKLGKQISEPGGGCSNQTTKGGGRPRRTTTIDAMMKSSEELNHRMMDTISTHLGEGWRSVIRDLGLTEGQIDQATIDHQIHGGVKEVIYQLLLTWTRGADDDEATLGVITTLLWKSGHRGCVEKMKETWKQENAARSAHTS